MARIGVEIVADASKLLKAFSTSAKASSTFTKELTVDSRVAAEAQIKAAVKTSESLKLQAATYRQVAASAQRGSAEQVAATRLAERAEQRLAHSMGVTAAEANHLDRNLGKMGRGALAGSGIFKTFGRSLAFASGGFLAFEGVSSFLRDSINAAREAGVANRSLAAQMKASGESFEVNRAEIEKVSLSYGKFGFQNDEVVQSLTVLERGTGKISEAFKLQGLAADIARAKNIGLSAAATVVAKVFGGQETALRRAVPGLSKNAHGWDLIAEAQRKMAGQAAAGTTASERFSATLHDTQEIIGKGLLPILNQYLDTLSKWMGDTRNQEKLQRAMNTAARNGATAFGALADGVGKASSAYGLLNDVIKKIPGNKGGLKGAFLAGLQDWLPQIKLVQDAAKAIQELRKQTDKPIARNTRDAMGRSPGGAGAFLPVIPAPAARPTSLAGRFNIQELKLAQAQLTARLDDDRKILVVEEAIVRKQIEQSKTLKERTALTNTLAGIVGQVRDIDTQGADALKAQAQARKDAAKAAADAAKAAKAAAKERQTTRLQTGLDWLDFGLEKAQATKGIGDDIKAEEKIIAALKNMAKLTGLTVDLARQIFEHRQALNDLLKQKQKVQQQAGANGPWKDVWTQFTPGGPKFFGDVESNPAALAEMRRLGVSGVMSPRQLPRALQLPVGGEAAKTTLTINGGLHLHGIQNVAQLEQDLQKRAGQRQQPRRGKR